MRERQAQRDSGKRPVDKVGTIEREGNTYRLTGEWHFEGKPGEEPTVHPGGKDVTALTGWTGPELANMAFHAENEKTLDRWRHPSRDTPKDPEAQREIGE